MAGLQGVSGTDGVVGSTGTLVSLVQGGSNKGYILGKSDQSTGWNKTFYVSSAYFQGGILYQGSDERLKDFKGDIEIDFETLKRIPKKYFIWKSSTGFGNGLQIGTSAQQLQKVYPELVSDDGNIKSVAYENLSIIALAAIDKLHEENEELKRRIEALEKR